MDKFSDKDVDYMRSALALARQGQGLVWPNPSVGCVIVKDGIVVSRARTADTGRPHAETQAISKAGAGARNADMYVTLEPCAHTGKTPPCCDAIVSAGIRRVVVACPDKDHRTDGKGIEALKRAGINVQVGLLSDTARMYNRGYFLNREQGRPMFTIKVATTLDAMIACGNGASKWITSTQTRRFAHLERANHDAVLTGIGTVLADDPELSVRLEGIHKKSPRIVIDTNLRLPVQSCILSTSMHGPVWIFTCEPEKNEKVEALSKFNVEIFRVPKNSDGHCDLFKVAAILGERGLTRVLVEAGQKLSGAFLRSGLCDRLLWFRSSGIIGGDGLSVFGAMGVSSLDQQLLFKRHESRMMGEDCLEVYERKA